MQPTMTPVNGGAVGVTSSTSSPAIVSRSHRPAVSSGGSVSVRSQRSENCIVKPGLSSPRGSCELPQEAKVVDEEFAQVVDAVAQHRQAIGAHAEREALVALGIDADCAQDVRMHLARAGDFEPAGAEAHVDFGGRLGERKKRWPKADREVVA